MSDLYERLCSILEHFNDEMPDSGLEEYSLAPLENGRTVVRSAGDYTLEEKFVPHIDGSSSKLSLFSPGYDEAFDTFSPYDIMVQKHGDGSVRVMPMYYGKQSAFPRIDLMQEGDTIHIDYTAFDNKHGRIYFGNDLVMDLEDFARNLMDLVEDMPRKFKLQTPYDGIPAHTVTEGDVQSTYTFVQLPEAS